MSDMAYLAVGVIMTLIGGLHAFVTVKHRLSCSEKVTATVAGVEKTAYRRKGTTRYEYLPIFSYTVNGRAYKSKGDQTSFRRDKYTVGNEYEIRCDPNFPENISNGTKVFSLSCDFLFIVFGITLTVCYFL